MRVKVKYTQLIAREGEVELDDDEFLDWVNEEFEYQTAQEAAEDDPVLIKEFLEAEYTPETYPIEWSQDAGPPYMELIEGEVL